MPKEPPQTIDDITVPEEIKNMPSDNAVFDELRTKMCGCLHAFVRYLLAQRQRIFQGNALPQPGSREDVSHQNCCGEWHRFSDEYAQALRERDQAAQTDTFVPDAPMQSEVPDEPPTLRSLQMKSLGERVANIEVLLRQNAERSTNVTRCMDILSDRMDQIDASITAMKEVVVTTSDPDVEHDIP